MPVLLTHNKVVAIQPCAQCTLTSVTSGCASLLDMASGGPDPDAPAVNGVAGWIPFGSGVGGALRRVPLNGVPLMFSFFLRDFPVKLRGAFKGRVSQNALEN